VFKDFFGMSPGFWMNEFRIVDSAIRNEREADDRNVKLTDEQLEHKDYGHGRSLHVFQLGVSSQV